MMVYFQTFCPHSLCKTQNRKLTLRLLGGFVTSPKLGALSQLRWEGQDVRPTQPGGLHILTLKLLRLILRFPLKIS